MSLDFMPNAAEHAAASEAFETLQARGLTVLEAEHVARMLDFWMGHVLHEATRAAVSGVGLQAWAPPALTATREDRFARPGLRSVPPKHRESSRPTATPASLPSPAVPEAGEGPATSPRPVVSVEPSPQQSAPIVSNCATPGRNAETRPVSLQRGVQATSSPSSPMECRSTLPFGEEGTPSPRQAEQEKTAAAVADMLALAKQDLSSVIGAAATMVGLADGAPHIAASALLEALNKAQDLLAVLEEAREAQRLASASIEAREPSPSPTTPRKHGDDLEALRDEAHRRAMATHRADYFDIYSRVFLDVDRDLRAQGWRRRR